MIIDDQLPCLKDGNGQAVPLFARCENANLFWVSLIEKAYAKLHQRYFALQGGSTVEALSDLTGMHLDNCFIDNGDQMTTPKLLFDIIKILCKEKSLLGAKLDMEMFSQMKKSTKEKIYYDA